MSSWCAVAAKSIMRWVAVGVMTAVAAGAAPRAASWRFPTGHPWSAGALARTAAAAGGIVLAGNHAEGTFQTPPIPLGRAYDRIVPNWNALTPAGSTVVIAAQLFRQGKPITGWVTMATWSRNRRGPRDAGDGEAKVDQDTMNVHAGADAVALRASLRRGSARATPILGALGVTAFSSKEPPSAAVTARAGQELKLDIPYRSQRTANPKISARVCGPTSTSMALAFHGVDLTIDTVAKLARDPDGAIAYGNWAYLAATAAELGMETEVRAMSSLDDVVTELAAGHPVIMAVSFKKGELAGSPISSTAGHLILARGVDRQGNIYVNDPAGRSAADGQIRYDRVQLTHAWRRGIGIVIRRAPRSIAP